MLEKRFFSFLFLSSTSIIFAQNLAPIVNDITQDVFSNQSHLIRLSSASLDLEGSNLTFIIENTSDHATVELNNNTGEVTYTSGIGFTGNDTFSYKAFDGTDYSDSASVTINIESPPNVAPTSSDIYLTTIQNIVVREDLTTVSDDLNEDTLQFEIVSQPQNGIATLSNEGKLTYTPNKKYVGTDTLSFKASDGALDGNVAQLSIVVNAAPAEAPVVNAASITTESDTTLDFSVSGFDSNYDQLSLSFTSTETDSGGILSFDNTPVFDSGITTFSVKYVPFTGFIGTENVSFSMSDGVETSTGVITILVTKKANSQPYTINKRVSIGFNSVDVDLGVSLIDPDGDILSVSEFPTQLKNGSVSFTSEQIFKFTPNNNFFGTDFFTFYSTDSSLTSPLSTVYVEVIGLADINADKLVNTIDLISLSSNIVGVQGYETPQSFNNVYDVNQDGAIDTIDLIHLASYIVGVDGYNIDIN